nr:hypothetical protein NHDPANJF_00139 [Enterobacter mori]
MITNQHLKNFFEPIYFFVMQCARKMLGVCLSERGFLYGYNIIRLKRKFYHWNSN